MSDRSHYIAMCLAEVLANKTDAQDYFAQAVLYARTGHYVNAKHTHERALACISRMAAWNERARLARAGKSK